MKIKKSYLRELLQLHKGETLGLRWTLRLDGLPTEVRAQIEKELERSERDLAWAEERVR